MSAERSHESRESILIVTNALMQWLFVLIRYGAIRGFFIFEFSHWGDRAHVQTNNQERFLCDHAGSFITL
jgi:hypothetical protein